MLLLWHCVVLFDDVPGGSVQELPHVVGEGHLQGKDDDGLVDNVAKIIGQCGVIHCLRGLLF